MATHAGREAARQSSYTPDSAIRMSDWLSLRLRLIDGFEAAEFEVAFGVSLLETVGPVLEDCVAAGVLQIAPRIRLTRRGRMLHGEVAARLLAHLSSHPEFAARV